MQTSETIWPPATNPVDFDFDVSRGAYSHLALMHKFGRNPSVPSATEADVWTVGGTYPFQQTAIAVRIASGGSANDDTAGSHARTVVVEGLDETWALVTETITTAGALASSATTTTFIRVFRAYVGDVGTYGNANDADIDIETTGAVTLARIPAGRGQSQLAVYTVPLGKTAYLEQVYCKTESNKATDFLMYQRRNADDTSVPVTGKRLVVMYPQVGELIDRQYRRYVSFPAKTDLWFAAIGPTGGGAVTAEFDLLLEDV
jgi:hypothetical protein